VEGMSETTSSRAPPSKAVVNLLALVGVCVAGYALYIEFASHEAERTGVAVSFFCDKLAAWMSCSRALTGPYGKVLSLWGLVAKGSALDVPNSAIGMLFYLLALAPWNALGARGGDLFMVAALASLAFSAYLGYVLYYVLHEFCIICVTSYCVNTLLFVAAGRLTLQMHRLAERTHTHAKLVRAAGVRDINSKQS
jgi:vitamin-K-epoxide reductase (warfarin-sensitive)